MPRSGSGTYNLPTGNPVIPGSVITSTWANSTMGDIGTALTQSIAVDGQTVPTADLPMASLKHTNVGNATLRNQYAAAGQVQDSSMQILTSVSGSNAIVASLASPPLAAYATGQSFRFIAVASNTGAVTININGIGVKSVTKYGTVPLCAGDILSGSVVELVYDGTQFQATSIYKGSMYGIQGAQGVLGSPTTSQATFSASALNVFSPTLLTSVPLTNTGSIVNDITVAGPTANGRDQAGAFAAVSEVHFYFIWNGVAIATVSSLSPPPTGPTLPTGYTHWAYICAGMTSASVLRVCILRGSRVTLAPLVSAAAFSSISTSQTNVSLTGIVPTTALNYSINARGTATSGGLGAVNAFISLTTPGGAAMHEIAMTTAAPSTLGPIYGAAELPYFGGTFGFLASNVANLVAISYTFNVTAYEVQNGS